MHEYLKACSKMGPRLCGLLLFAFSGMLTGLVAAELEGPAVLGGTVLCLFLVTMAAIDYTTGLLPDRGNLFLAGVGLLFVLTGTIHGLSEALFGAAVGAGVLLLLRVLSRGGLGLGDVKYAAAFGIWLGGEGTFLALLLAFAIGAVLALVLLACGRLQRNSELAFGPFLSAGAYLSYLGLFW